jgi:hypothetical protein
MGKTIEERLQDLTDRNYYISLTCVPPKYNGQRSYSAYVSSWNTEGTAPKNQILRDSECKCANLDELLDVIEQRVQEWEAERK